MKIRIAGVICLSLGAASTLLGDVTTSYFNSGTDYGWRIEHMPDFDQQRDGLAAASDGQPGGSHCVPTACTNLFAYMASHGFPNIGPAFADWENDENYEEVTDFIDALGDSMLTSGTYGTNQGVAFLRMLSRVSWNTGGAFTVEHEMWSPFNVVKLREMACSGIQDDAIQVFCYGQYEDIGTNDWGEQVVWRAGGHCMTFVGAERAGSQRKIWAADPDDDNDEDDADTGSQNGFFDSTWSVERMDNVVVAPNVFLSYLAINQDMTRVMRGSSDFRLIDSRIVVRPVGCASWGEFEGDTTVNSSQWSVVNAGMVTRLVASAAFTPSSMFKTAGGQIVLIERTEQGEPKAWFERFEDTESGIVPVEIGPLPGDVRFKDLTFSKDRTLLVLAEDQRLYGLPGYDDGGRDVNFEANPEDYVLMSNLQGIQQIAHDTESGTTYLLDRSTRRLLIADRNFENVIEHFVPDGVPMDLPPNGRLEFKADANGNLFFNVSGSNELWMVRSDTGQAEVLGQLMAADLRGFDFDDFGNLLLNDSGKVRCFSFTDEGLVETGNGGSLFAGLDVGMGLCVDRASSNFDPKHHEREGWLYQLIDEPCDQENCDEGGNANAADLDGDGTVDGGDLGLLLAAWGGSGADINGDGTTDGADMGLLLAAWGSTQP